MEFALKGKGALVAASLMLVAFLVSPAVAFAKPDETVKAEVDLLMAQVEVLTQALADETAARQAADAALQNAIGVEESSRISGDNNEAAARAAEDSALYASIGRLSVAEQHRRRVGSSC